VVWYLRPPSGGQYGPATADILRNWIAEGRVSADTLVWREGWRDWQEASEVFPQFGAGQPAFGPGPVVGTATAATASAAHRPVRRRASKGVQIAMLTGLILVVLVLLVLFLLVVFGPVGGSGAESAAAGAMGMIGLLWQGPPRPKASPAA